MTGPPQDDSYKTIKERLFDNHQLTGFQPVEKLHAMEAVGDSVLIQCTVSVNVPEHSRKDLFLLILLYPRTVKLCQKIYDYKLL
jgi:hypothetical protein